MGLEDIVERFTSFSFKTGATATFPLRENKMEGACTIAVSSSFPTSAALFLVPRCHARGAASLREKGAIKPLPDEIFPDNRRAQKERLTLGRRPPVTARYSILSDNTAEYLLDKGVVVSHYEVCVEQNVLSISFLSSFSSALVPGAHTLSKLHFMKQGPDKPWTVPTVV
jgi:hypothetical protein